MHQVFEVPGTITLRDVSRPAPAETPAQRLHRLAAKAVIEGCIAARLTGTDVYRVTSGSRSGVVYTVDAAAGTCTCAVTQPCKHWSLIVMQLIAERDRLRGLAARGRCKSTADFHRLQDAERRAERFAVADVPPVSGTPTVSERSETDSWAAGFAETVHADVVPARYAGVCALSVRAFGRGARIVEVGDGHGPNAWALADAVIAGHLGPVAA